MDQVGQTAAADADADTDAHTDAYAGADADGAWRYLETRLPPQSAETQQLEGEMVRRQVEIVRPGKRYGERRMAPSSEEARRLEAEIVRRHIEVVRPGEQPAHGQLHSCSAHEL